MPGGGWRLTRPTKFAQPVRHAQPAAETAGAAASKSLRRSRKAGAARTLRCGLRAVFCRRRCPARPEACRISRRDRAAAMLLAGARGYRGRRRLAAPCALPASMTAITQTINRERSRPGSNIEANSPAETQREQGHFRLHADISPGGGWRLMA